MQTITVLIAIMPLQYTRSNRRQEIKCRICEICIPHAAPILTKCYTYLDGYLCSTYRKNLQSYTAVLAQNSEDIERPEPTNFRANKAATMGLDSSPMERADTSDARRSRAPSSDPRTPWGRSRRHTRRLPACQPTLSVAHRRYPELTTGDRLTSVSVVARQERCQGNGRIYFVSMRQPKSVQQGDFGETAVELFFKQLGWGPLSTGSQDLGTDLYIQLRDKQLLDLRLMLGAQVKTGNSLFYRPAIVDGREGWWYSESDNAHADYWSNHHVPHILILQSKDLSTRVWAALTERTIIDTGKGFKVFVPADQRLEPGNATKWIELAVAARESIALEGSRWSFSVGDLPEAAWARHALIAPRLIAPHPNKGISAPINWAEAVAVCIEARPNRWHHFADRFEDVPTPDQAMDSESPGWRFAAAVYEWVTEGTPESLRQLDLTPAGRSLRVARAVCLSIAEFDDLQFNAARGALEAESLEDELSVDQAWLSTHQARILAETGNIPAALDILERTNTLIASVATDVTVSALRSAALWSLFELTNRFDADLSKVAPAMDTATAWWRNQATASGLEDAAERIFNLWGRDKSIRFGGANIAHNELFSASLTARLAGDHGSWRSTLGLMAIVDLSTHGANGPSVADSLDSLRRAGGEDQLRLALAKIRDDGPLADLSHLMTSIRPETITRTTWRADLAALTLAGSYCPPERAKTLISFLLSGLRTQDLWAERFGEPTPSHRMLEALTGLLGHFDDEHAKEVIEFALSLREDASQLLDRGLSSLLAELDEDVLAGREPDFAAKANDATLPGWLRNIFAARAPMARDVLHESLVKGDVRALPALGTLAELTTEEAVALTRTCAGAFEGYRRSHNGFAIHQMDMAQLCTGLAILLPESGAWGTIVAFLCDTDAYPAPKRAACKILAENPGKIPGEHREHLAASLRMLIADKRPDPTTPHLTEIGGAFHELLLELLPQQHADRSVLEGALLSGGEKTRCDAVDYYSRRHGSESILLALAHDANHQVSSRAMFGLAKLAATGDGLENVYSDALASFASADGESNALHVLGGVEAGEPAGNFIDLISGLTTHPSATVRGRANHVLNRLISKPGR